MIDEQDIVVLDPEKIARELDAMAQERKEAEENTKKQKRLFKIIVIIDIISISVMIFLQGVIK